MPACPKPEPRKKLKARSKRQQKVVEMIVRAKIMQRDGGCRFRFNPELGQCRGNVQWAHLWDHTRAKTRGQDAWERHTQDTGIMACVAHHDAIDGRAYPRLTLKPLTPDKANGPLQAIRTELVHGESVTTVAKVEIPANL